VELLGQFVLFLVCAAAIFLSGRHLPQLGSRVASKVGLSATSLGLFVLALITSLPELTVTITALVGQEAPDLALGNILGSNNFNLTTVALLELIFAGGVFLGAVHSSRYTATSWTLLTLTTLVGVGVVAGGRIDNPALPVLLFSVPVLGICILDWRVGRQVVSLPPVERTPDASRVCSTQDQVQFALLAIVVVVAGILMSRAADAIARHTFVLDGRDIVLGRTFVGSLLLAVATSLPEVTVAIAAVTRERSPDIALGTLMGSNVFNILIFALFAPLLLLRTGHSAWIGLADANLANVVTGLVLTSLVFVGMLTRLKEVRILRTSLPTAIMIPAYLAGLYLVLMWSRS
jgi:cation:H+ antiporter